MYMSKFSLGTVAGIEKRKSANSGAPSVVAQPAARLTETQALTLAQNIGGLGHSNLTLAMLCRINATAALTEIGGVNQIIGCRHGGNGRLIQIQTDNTFGDYKLTIGDSQTGTAGGAFATQPPINEWIFLALSSPAASGTLLAAWQRLSGDTTQRTITRANGVEASVQAQNIFVNGEGTTGVLTSIDVQYIRGYDSYSDAASLAAQALSTNAAGALFWWGVDSGGVWTDKSGNNRTPTVVGTPAIRSDGPVIAAM